MGRAQLILTAILIYTMLAVTNDNLQIRIDSPSISKLRMVISESDSEPRSYNNIQADYSLEFSKDNPELADARSVSAFLSKRNPSPCLKSIALDYLVMDSLQMAIDERESGGLVNSVCLGCAFPDSQVGLDVLSAFEE
jgi:hypothetical protein